jgi:hypothetical protein
MFEKITKIKSEKVKKIVESMDGVDNFKFSTLENESNKIKVKRINGKLKLNIDDIKRLDKEFDGLIDKKTSYIKNDELYLDFNYFGSELKTDDVEDEDDETLELNFYK